MRILARTRLLPLLSYAPSSSATRSAVSLCAARSFVAAVTPGALRLPTNRRPLHTTPRYFASTMSDAPSVGPAPAAGAAAAPAAATATSTPPPRGAFILLEGLDRSGKSSQCLRLAEALNAQNKDAALSMRFPDRTTAIGQMIDAYLKQSAHIDDHAIHLLFSANRWEAQSGMMSALKRGQHLVVDRYAYSGVAFSGSKVLPADALPLSLDWAAASDRGLPAPDVVLFLDISKEAASSRGGFGQERYETTEIQERVRQAFNQLRLQAAEEPPAAADAGGKQQQQQQAAFGAGVPWRVIDAGRSRDEVAADILRLAQETIVRVAKERAPIKFL